MMKNLIIPVLFGILSFSAIAGIETSTQGEGLPSFVGTLAPAEVYREEFIIKNSIETYEKYGITHYTNNKIGLGLVKKENIGENAFRDILKKTQDIVETWKHGRQFIKRIKDYSSVNTCIPKITSTSHGWASAKGGGDFHGLTGKSRRDGIYANSSTRPGGFSKIKNRNVESHLAKLIDKGQVNFCDRCIIQFYACNVSTLFAKSVAKVSGCQVVVATGKASPRFQSMETREDKLKVWNGSHYWSSGAAFWEDRTHAEWFRVTPIKDGYGEVQELVEENLGRQYIAI